MANRNRNNEPKPVGDLNQPLGGDNPEYEPGPKDRDWSPADEQRQEKVERDLEVAEANESPVGEAAKALGTSAVVTKIAEPDTYIVQSGEAEFSFTGDIEEYLTRSGVTDINYIEPSS